MKKILIITTMLALFCASCSNGIHEQDSTSPEGTGRLFVQTEDSARTILPESIDFTTDAGVTFALNGTCGQKSFSRKWNSYSEMIGDTAVYVDVGVWTFTLTVCRNSVALMTSTQTFSVQAGNNPLSFTEWQKKTDGTGGIQVTLNFPPNARVSKITASLSTLAGEAVSGFDQTYSITTQSSVSYAFSAVPTETYLLTFKFYTEDTGETPVNTYTELVHIAPAQTSCAVRTVQNIDTLYSITYANLADVSLDGSITLPASFNASMNIALPCGVENLHAVRQNYYAEFYETADFSGEKVTGWNAGERTADITLYAKWICTADTVKAAIEALTGKEVQQIYVAGVITLETIQAIADGINAVYVKNDTTKRTPVAVDLYDTTGVTTWHNDYSVVKYFRKCLGLYAIRLPKNMMSIGGYAFDGCSGLTSVTIPSSVTSIEYWAFRGCSGLTSVTIPEGVTSISREAFYDCTGLTAVYYTGTLEQWLGIQFFDAKSNPLYYAHHLYIDGSEVTSVVFPDSRTRIGYEFSGCSGLTSVTIPSSVTSIADSAFYKCSGLTSVTIPSGVTSIGSLTFYDCSELTEVTIPEGVTSIADSAFYKCSSLTSVAIPSSVTSIGFSAFDGCSGLTEVTIPEGVTSIERYTFQGCSGLTSVTIPEGVTSIGNWAFYGCSRLTSITIPSSVTSIGNWAFYECSGLTEVTISEGVTSIGRTAFSGCYELTSVTIPKSVMSIGDGAFTACSKITSVTISEGVTSIGERAFLWCVGLTSLTIPSTVTSIGKDALVGFNTRASLTFKTSDGWYYTDDETVWTNKTTASATKIADASTITVEDFYVSGLYNGKYLFRVDE